MRKRILSLICAAAMAVSLAAFTPVSALSSAELAADTLYTLGLVKGDGTGFNLTAQPTRAEALTMIVRLSGAEKTAQATDWSTPFRDVTEWAKPYVGYAYSNYLTSGTSATTFSPNETVSANQFCTFLLRLMGYSEKSGDFTYETAALTCYRLGITSGNYSTKTFTRGDMFTACLGALSRKNSDGAALIDTLIDSGAVSSAVATAVGLGDNQALTAREIAERYSSAVFFIQGWTQEKPTADDAINNTASGFFISADGLAVTNYHAIADDQCITAMTTDGKIYPAESVIYYDKDIDIAVLRISKKASDGTSVASFPYLEMLPESTIHTGDKVYTLSNPLGLQSSISDGIVSNPKRETLSFTVPVIQNTAAISMGSSGGALLNEFGQVIGVTSAYYYYGNSLYLAVPMDTVLAQDLTGDGKTLSEVYTIEAAKAAAAAAESGAAA
ncbi:MAG: trypsin-like peptidase domain-containing protein [Oscillospiraceae bacterium]|nr:trypsin-like peptidase domain-containing protein [Oscillospiraceae bacterium]